MTILMTLCLVALLSLPALAQQDPLDQGNADVISVVLNPPEVGAATPGSVEVYFNNDVQSVASATVGFKWDNPKIQMDSARISPVATAAFNFTTFLWYANDINQTNEHQAFQFGGARLFGDGLAPSTGPQLICTYYFTATDWTAADGFCIDTTVFSAGTIMKFVDNNNVNYFPVWAGETCFNVSEPMTLATDPTSLNFSATIGEAAPATQTIDVTETGGNNIAYTAVASDSWIVLTNPDGTTPGMITVGIDHSALTVPDMYNGTVTISSGEADNSPVTVDVSLELAQGNQPPVLAAIGNQSTDENVLLEFGVSATDPDEDGLTLTTSTLPTGASFTDNGDGTGTFSWTPTFDQAGDYPVTFTVTDGSLSDFEEITITVNNVNRAPELAAIGAQSVNEGANLNFGVSATDPDSDGLTLTTSALPTGASFTDNGDGTGTFDWTPDNTQSGLYAVTFTVSDGDMTDFEEISITVIDMDGLVADPMTLNFSMVEGGPLPDDQTFGLSVSDGSTVDFSISYEPSVFFSATPLTGTTPTDITISIDSNFVAGNYSDSLQVIPTVEEPLVSLAPEEVEPIWVYINLEVLEPAKFLAVDPTSLSFTISEGDVTAPVQSFDITEVGGTGILFIATANVDWLDVVFSTGLTPDVAEVALVGDAFTVPPGEYNAEITVASDEAENSPIIVPVTLTVTECPVLEPATIVLAENALVIEGESLIIDDMLAFSSSTDDEIAWTATNTDYFTFDPTSGTTPTTPTFHYEHTFMTAGMYSDTAYIMSDDQEICPSMIMVIVNVTVIRPPSADTVISVSTPAVPGMVVEYPIVFTNSCPLTGLYVGLTYPAENMTLDSVSFVGSVIEYVTDKDAVIDEGTFSLGITANVGAQEMVPVGSEQHLATLWFSLNCEILDGTYAINVTDPDTGIYFNRDCGIGTEVEVPEFIPGSIIVGSASSFVCGYVVDPDMNEIVGATVDLYAEFPVGSPEMTTMSNTYGGFAFDDIETIPFDLYAYADGYYPGRVDNVNFGEKGVVIILEPLPTLTPTSEWVDYYCPEGGNTYFDGVLPIGAVVEAWVGELLVGQKVVTVAGQYGFMPVYRASDEFGDDGATTGDNIMFTVDGLAAVANGSTIYPSEYMQVPVCLEVRGTATKECTLYEGWNLVSWNINTSSDDIMEVLAPVMDYVDVVLGFEQGGLTFDPDLQQFSTLWSVDHLSGYWIRIEGISDVTLEVTGLPVPETTPIPLTAGWNLVSYLPLDIMDVEDAFASLMTDNLLAVYGFDINDGIKIYRPDQPDFNTLETLGTCHGFWVKVNEADVLTYVMGGLPILAKGFAIPEVENPHGVVKSNAWVNLYSENLTVDGKTVKAGSVITAHASDDDQVIGAYTMKTDGTFGFMSVYSDDNTGMHLGDEFYLQVDGVATEETFEWTGRGDRIPVLALSTGNGSNLPDNYSLEQNYPNPFNPTTTIKFSLPSAGSARLEVYNILGKLVAVPFDGQAIAGENTVVWDGRDASGNSVASGVYLYRLTSGSYTEARKMMLLK